MRLIDANELREEILDDEDYIFDNDTVNHFLDLVDLSPTIDAEPVVHGHWVTRYKSKYYHCSICGGLVEDEWHNCPHCRAKMDCGSRINRV